MGNNQSLTEQNYTINDLGNHQSPTPVFVQPVFPDFDFTLLPTEQQNKVTPIYANHFHEIKTGNFNSPSFYIEPLTF